MRFATALIVALLLQSPTDKPSLAFEVASVRASRTDSPPGNFGILPGGRFLMINGSVRSIITMAYPDTPEIVSLPGWVNTERFDILATAGRNATRGEMLTMLRSLLAERFQFAAHVDHVERSTFALVVADPDGTLGPRMRRIDVDCDARLAAADRGKPIVDDPLLPAPCTVRMARGRILSRGMTMPRLARTLRGAAGRPVVDRTGIAGDYAFELEFDPAPLAARDSGTPETRPGLSTALEEQLGLRLVVASNGVTVLVVDRIERPDPN